MSRAAAGVIVRIAHSSQDRVIGIEPTSANLWEADRSLSDFCSRLTCKNLPAEKETEFSLKYMIALRISVTETSSCVVVLTIHL